MIEGLPVLDAHIHLDPAGAPVDAVKRFISAGGTHLLVVHKPYGNIPEVNIDNIEKAFLTTVRMAELARKTGAGTWCVIGPYPGLLPSLAERMGLEGAKALQMKALDLAFRFVDEGRALGVGEIGRVHFPVDPEIQSACDGLLVHAFREAGKRNCPVVLHTESPGANNALFDHLAGLAESTGVRKERVIKHYSGWESADPGISRGFSVSMQARRKNLEEALSRHFTFLLETDYIDDPARPNVVMPPDTVPKKIAWCHRRGLLDRDLHEKLMVELPERVLGMDTTS